jgi:quercetin dioxygenase-like cupin family protein
MFVKATESGVEQVDAGVTRQILGYDPQLMMVRVTFEKGAVGASHSHPHRQVTFVERGRFEVTISGTMTVLQAGDCFLTPPDAVHGVVALEDGALVDVFTPAREDFLRA